MADFLLKCQTDYGVDELYFNGKCYKMNGQKFADVDTIENAKHFKSYAAARQRCHELNKFLLEGRFVVKEI